MEKSLEFEDLFRMPEVKRMAVVGSRDWPDKGFVFSVLEEWLANIETLDTIVSGGQPRGVDGWAKEFAEENGLLMVEHLPAHMYPEDDERYAPYHVSNYHRRNSAVVHDCDILLAFCYRGSSGTLSTYEKAKKKLGARARLYTEKDSALTD